MSVIGSIDVMGQVQRNMARDPEPTPEQIARMDRLVNTINADAENVRSNTILLAQHSINFESTDSPPGLHPKRDCEQLIHACPNLHASA